MNEDPYTISDRHVCKTLTAESVGESLEFKCRGLSAVAQPFL